MNDNDLIEDAKRRAEMQPAELAQYQAKQIVNFCKSQGMNPGEATAAMATAIQAIIYSTTEPGAFRRRAIQAVIEVIKP